MLLHEKRKLNYCLREAQCYDLVTCAHRKVFDHAYNFVIDAQAVSNAHHRHEDSESWPVWRSRRTSK